MKEKNQKLYKMLKIAIIILTIILVAEAIYFGIKIYKNRQSTTYYTTINSIVKDDNQFIGVGLSDFKHSNLTDYEKPGYNKPVIWVYDKDYKIKKEIKYNEGYNGVFYDVISTSDGYIAVGALEMTEAMHKTGSTEGILVKFDKDLNIIWQENLQILDTTKLVKVKLDKDENIIAVGESIYEPDIIGNHTTGGAIIVKYDQNGNRKQTINYGGPKTGLFNDVIITNDGYVAVGLTSTGTGIIFKYDFNGKEIWHNYYGYTDSKGLTSINYINNTFVVTGSKLEEKGNTDSYKGAIVKFDNNGKLIKEEFYEKDKISRIETSIIDDDKIIAIALYGKKENDTLINQSVILEYNLDLELQKENKLVGDNTVTFTNLIKNNNNYLVVGHTNSKLKGFKTNGYDYYPIVIAYNKELNQQ